MFKYNKIDLHIIYTCGSTGWKPIQMLEKVEIIFTFITIYDSKFFICDFTKMKLNYVLTVLCHNNCCIFFFKNMFVVILCASFI